MTEESYHDLALRTAEGIEERAAAYALLAENDWLTPADTLRDYPDEYEELRAARAAIEELDELPWTIAQGVAFDLLTDYAGIMPRTTADEEPESYLMLCEARRVLGLDPLLWAFDDAWDADLMFVALDNWDEGLDEARENYASWDPLSIERVGRDTGDGWEVDHIVIVVTTGGPHVEIRVDTGGRARVVAYGWGRGGESSVSVDADAVMACYRCDYMLEESC